jgi:hypothetical protein
MSTFLVFGYLVHLCIMPSPRVEAALYHIEFRADQSMFSRD